MFDLEIIEDCSPFFIRFKHKGANEVIDLCRKFGWNHYDSWKHYTYPIEYGEKIAQHVPFKDALDISLPYRATMYITPPRYKNVVHKDNWDVRWSINYTVHIKDADCITSWWDESATTKYDWLKTDMVDRKIQSRVIRDFDFKNEVPLKQMTAIEGEVLLFNTDIWHNWDNSRSSNERVILTLRTKSPADFYFDDAKKILFNL